MEYIEDEIIIANNDCPEDGVVHHIFNDDDEHFYHGKFGDGVAVLTKDPEECDVPEKLVMTYPKIGTVKSTPEMAVEARDYAGLGNCSEITYYHIALKYGVPSEPRDVELPF